MAYVGIGEDFEKGGNWTRNNEAHALWQTEIWKIAYDLLATGKLRVHPVRVENTGFAGILRGLKELEDGTVSGQKLVYVL